MKATVSIVFVVALLGLMACSSPPATQSSDMDHHPMATIQAGALFVPPKQRHPAYNTTMDPNKNPNINPTKNPNINPNKNPNLHPDKNPNINPDKNPNLHPNKNPNINPNKNPNLHPDKSPNLHPGKNPKISPLQTSDYQGYYAFAMDGTAAQIAIPTDDAQCLLYFDTDLTFQQYALSNGESGFNVFDLNGTWLGYLQSNGAEGYNFFDLKGEWKSYLN